MQKKYKNMTEIEFLKKDILISQIFRKILNLTKNQ